MNWPLAGLPALATILDVWMVWGQPGMPASWVVGLAVVGTVLTGLVARFPR